MRSSVDYRWEPISEPAVPENRPVLKRIGHAAVAVDGYYIYIIGGRTSTTTFSSDIMRYDIKKGAWDMGLPSGKFQGRGYHSATVVGRHIWIVGGRDGKCNFDDVHRFDLDTLEWQQMRIQGQVGLLSRSAHGAVVHPCKAACLLIFGGICSNNTNFSNQLLILDTAKRRVDEVTVESGSVPKGRAYHTFTALGTHCVAVGGLAHSGGLTRGVEYVAVYDAQRDCWVSTETGGRPQPLPRSNHRAVAVGDRIVVHGGALSNGDYTSCMDSMQLQLRPLRVVWSDCDNTLCHASHPPGRAGHALAHQGNKIYIFAGYRTPETPARATIEEPMHSDAWAVNLPPTLADAEQHCVALLKNQQRQEAARRPQPIGGWRQSVRQRSQVEDSQSPRADLCPPTHNGAPVPQDPSAALTGAHTLPTELGILSNYPGDAAAAVARCPFHGRLYPLDGGPPFKILRTTNGTAVERCPYCSALSLPVMVSSEHCADGGMPVPPTPASAPGMPPPPRSPVKEAQLAALQSQLQKVTEELREAREKISAKSREAEEAAAKLHNCEGALQHSEMRAATLATDAEGTKQELQRQRELTAQLTANHKKDLELLGERQLDLQKALSEAASARREAADAVEEGCRKAAEFDHETDNLRRSLEKQRESYSTMYALVQAKERELGEERKALDSFKVELAKERELRNAEADQAAKAVRQAKSQMASWQSRCAAAESQARQHGLDLDETKAKLKAAEERLSRLEPEYNQKSAELAHLREAAISWEGHKKGAETSVKQLTQHIEAIQRLLPSFLPPS